MHSYDQKFMQTLLGHNEIPECLTAMYDRLQKVRQRANMVGFTDEELSFMVVACGADLVPESEPAVHTPPTLDFGSMDQGKLLVLGNETVEYQKRGAKGYAVVKFANGDEKLVKPADLSLPV